MNLNLWRSLYSYSGEFPGSLSFKENEYFLVLRKENEYWFLVSEHDGTIGCVPVNYLIKENVSYDKTIRFVDKAINSLSQKSASVINGRDNLLCNLLEFRSKGEKPCESEHNSSNQNGNKEDHKPPSVIPPGLAFELTDAIRQTTHASHECSRKGLQVLLQLLQSNVPDMKLWIDAIENQLSNSTEFDIENAFQRSPDWIDLTDLFEFFHQRKNDSQERSWALHEQVGDLRKKLSKLLKILKMSNRILVLNFLELSPYESFMSLIEWYQMERRVIIRRLLLQIFIVCSEISPRSLDVCLQSILPLELVRDLQTTNADMKNFTYAALLLSILVNSPHSITVDLHDKLNVDFCLNMLCKLSEYHNTLLNSHQFSTTDYISDDSTEEYAETSNSYALQTQLLTDDVIFMLFLVLNKKFNDVKSNPVLKSLQSKPECSRLFIEKLIRAFNRDSDPVIKNRHGNGNSDGTVEDNNSVRKILCDIYSRKHLSEIIYRNDADVIIDIISRELCNLQTNCSELSEYLLLLDLIVTNSDYLDKGKYKLYDLKQALMVLKNTSHDEINECDQALSESLIEKLDGMVV